MRALKCSFLLDFWTGFQPKVPFKMTHSMTMRRIMTTSVACLTLAAVLTTTTGCQVDLNGQTLPSPYYLQDDVQYFPAGPEFKLPREAAALKAARAEEKLNRR